MAVDYNQVTHDLKAFLDKYKFVDPEDVPEGYQPEDKHKMGVRFMGKISFLDGYGATSELNQAIYELHAIHPGYRLAPFVWSK